MKGARLWSVEGNEQWLDGGAMFGHAPRELWGTWVNPDERNRVRLACRALLVAEPHRTVLFETGIGAFFAPALRERFGVHDPRHLLLTNLAKTGAAAEDVDVVVLSHLHFDHAGGLLAAFEPEAPLRLAFPKARFVVSEAGLERARQPHLRDRVSFIPELAALLEASGRLEVVRDGRSATLGPDYTFHWSEGHTPGLMLTEIPSADGPIVFVADLAPGRAWVHAPITMAYDRFAERAVDEKQALFGDLAARGGRLFFTHDVDVAMARLARDARGRFGTSEDRAELLDEPL